MRGLVVALLLASACLAGCTAGDSSSGLTPAPSATSSTAASNSTTAVPVTPALTANLTADVVNGSAPLAVNFTLSSGGGLANLTWTLMAALFQRVDATGDNDGNATGASNGTEPFDPSGSGNLTTLANGTSLPATVNHTFVDGGAWTVLLVVESGPANATARVTIDVAGGNATAERVPLVLAEYANTGLIGGPYALTNDPMMAHQCPGFNAGQDGVGCVFLPFSAVGAHDGMPATITTDAANFRLAFWDDCAPTGSGVGFASGASGDQFEVPAGAGCGVAWSSNTGDWGEDRTFTLTVYDWLPDPDDE